MIQSSSHRCLYVGGRIETPESATSRMYDLGAVSGEQRVHSGKTEQIPRYQESDGSRADAIHAESRDGVLGVRSERDGQTHTLYLAGEFDLAAEATFSAAIERAEAEDSACVVIDLAEVTFMDSTGLRCLIEASERAMRNHRRLRIAHPQPMVRELFVMTQLDQAFDIAD